MKKIVTILFLNLVIISISFSSCKEDEVPSVEPSVEFLIANPMVGTMYEKGDTVFITGMLHWEKELHGYEITLTNTTQDSVVFTAHGHDDTKMLNITQMWINNNSSNSDMTLTIDALTDHEGAKQSKDIKFKCHTM